MTHHDAFNLIRKGVTPSDAPQTWVELGCGTGTFTRALAQLMGKGEIVAVDQDETALSSVPDQYDKVSVKKIRSDLTKFSFPVNTHGILMANSLHFVPDKADFLRQVALQLPSFTLIIVEYEGARANPWVPYPIDSGDLEVILRNSGAKKVEKTGEHPSRYHGNMYALKAQISLR